jgi:hypothetical protein
MNKPVSDLRQMLSSMQPELNDGVYVFSSLPLDAAVSHLPAIATFREIEGLTLIVEESLALQERLPILFRAAWITLKVHSDFAAVGLIAAFAGSLGSSSISCNVSAAAYHDHIFVPYGQAQAALAVLRSLQERSAQGDPEDIDWGR